MVCDPTQRALVQHEAEQQRLCRGKRLHAVNRTYFDALAASARGGLGGAVLPHAADVRNSRSQAWRAWRLMGPHAGTLRRTVQPGGISRWGNPGYTLFGTPVAGLERLPCERQ